MHGSITIRSEGGEMEIEFQDMGSLERMRWFAMLPDQFSEVDSPHELEFNEELLDYTVELIESLTVLNEDVINALPMSELQRLMEASFCVLGNVPINVPDNPSSEQFRVDESDEQFDLNEDGAVDLEDWR